jgi:hypothetical protein
MAAAPGVGFPDVFGDAWTLPLGWCGSGGSPRAETQAATLRVRFVVVDIPIDDVGAFPADLDALPWRSAWAARADVRGSSRPRDGVGARRARVLDVPSPGAASLSAACSRCCAG